MKTPEQVRRAIIRCERCELSARPGIRPVPWRGPLKAPIAIVGEAPGTTENDRGLPFVGDSGKLLHELLEKQRMDLDDCFICNTVSCFPGGTPSRKSEEACRVHLKRQLALSQAQWVLALGNVALRYWLPDRRILSTRGQTIVDEADRTVFFTVHPAWAMRSEDNLNLLKKDIRRFCRLVRA